MLKRIPSIFLEDLNAYFASIYSELTGYESSSKAPMLLELAIWNSEFNQQLGQLKRERESVLIKSIGDYQHYVSLFN